MNLLGILDVSKPMICGSGPNVNLSFNVSNELTLAIAAINCKARD